MGQIYRFSLVIVTAIMLSSCALTGPIIAVGALTVGGVASQPIEHQYPISEIEIKSNKLETVKTIALLDIPDLPNTDNENTVFCGLSFGKTSQDFLKQFLEENGFEVIEYTPNRKDKFRLIRKYKTLDIKGADAYLDVVPVSIEFSTVGDELGPYVSAVVRLVSASTNEVIYAGSVQYGWGMGRWDSGIRIESPEDHKYESYEIFHAEKEEATGYLLQGFEAVSLSIAKNISTGEFHSVMQPPIEDVLSDDVSAIADLTGNYRSNVAGHYNNKFTFKIEQDGNKIRGISHDKLWGFEGVRDGISIRFNSYGSGTTGKGKFTIDSCGNLFGEYQRDSSGIWREWVLARTEDVVSDDSNDESLESVGIEADDIAKSELLSTGESIGTNRNVSTSNQNEQPLPGPDITGTYVSDIDPSSDKYLQRNRDMVLMISQNGNTIIATDKSSKVIIKGTREGNTINFLWINRFGGSSDIDGEWKISTDGSRLTGTWDSFHRGGTWNLTKIQ